MCLLSTFLFFFPVFLYLFFDGIQIAKSVSVCVCSEFYLMRWYVSQYMKMGCAPAMDMVRYILS